MVKSVLTIRSDSDLNCLLDNRIRYSCIELCSDVLSESDRQRYEARLMKYYLSCGCSVGSFSMVGVMLFLLPYTYLEYRSGEASLMQAVSVLFFVMGSALVVGKVAGLGMAKLGLIREIKRLRVTLAEKV